MAPCGDGLEDLGGLTTVTDPNAVADQQVLATNGATVTLAQDDYNGYPGRNSLLWDDGHAFLGEQLDITGTPGDGEVTYEMEVTRGELTEGQEAVWSSWYYDYGDPSDRGLEFSEVTPRSDVGDLPSLELARRRRPAEVRRASSERTACRRRHAPST